MDIRPTGVQGAAPLARGWKRETLAAALRFLATVIVLSAMVTSMPHALELATIPSVTDREPATVEDYFPEPVEEPIEPLIVDDIRTEGRMVASLPNVPS